MMNSAVAERPSPLVVLELLKPITWFPPMWALGCGIVSSGVSPGQRWPLIAAGVLLAGPMVCGTSQAVNDWYDRHDKVVGPDHAVLTRSLVERGIGEPGRGAGLPADHPGQDRSDKILRIGTDAVTGHTLFEDLLALGRVLCRRRTG